jgi:hypothetical protein
MSFKQWSSEKTNLIEKNVSVALQDTGAGVAGETTGEHASVAFAGGRTILAQSQPRRW